MKKLHKALMGVTALVMAFSVSAMAACGSGSNSGDSGKPGNSGTVTGGLTIKNADVKKTVEALNSQSFKAMGMSVNFSETSNSKSYASDENGVKIAGAEESSYKSTDKMEMTQKININTFESDMTESYDRKVYFNNVLDQEYSGKTYGYDFMRGNYSFGVDSDTSITSPITDFSNVTLKAYDASMPEEISAIIGLMPEEGLSGDMLAPLTTVLTLADVYDGAAFANNKLTLNFNKVAYKLYNEVLEVIDSLDDNTTVGDLFGATPVKNLINCVTYGMDAKEIYDQVVETVKEMAGAQAGAQVDAMLEKLPVPKAGESIYSYLVKLLDSKDVAELVFAMAMPGMPSSAIAPFSQFKVSEIIAMIMQIMGNNGGNQGNIVSPMMAAAAPDESESGTLTMTQIKKMVKGLLDNAVTVTEDKFTVNTSKEDEYGSETNVFEISGLELVFNVGSNYTVSSVSFSADIKTSGSRLEHYGDDYMNHEEQGTVSISSEIVLSNTEYTLTDISNNKVKLVNYDFADETHYEQILDIQPMKEEGERTIVAIGVTIESGNIKDIAAYTVEYGEEDYVYTRIESSVIQGNTLTFEVEGLNEPIVYELDINDNSRDENNRYIHINGGLVGEIQTEDYYVDNYSAYLLIYTEEIVTETTVSALLAK